MPFGELTDVAEQRARFAAAMAEKQRIHGERYPVDEDFLDALAQMPPACGIALGFDRLVMLATGASRIEQVIWAPVVEFEAWRHDDDAKLQTLRTPAQLCEHGLIAPAQLPRSSGGRALRGGAAAGAGRADRPDDARDPIARQFVPDAAELEHQPQELADPIGDDAHRPVEGIVHRYPDRVLLKLTHVCAVYCRFCFRREMVGPDKPNALSRRRSRRARLHPHAYRKSGK